MSTIQKSSDNKNPEVQALVKNILELNKDDIEDWTITEDKRSKVVTKKIYKIKIADENQNENQNENLEENREDGIEQTVMACTKDSDGSCLSCSA